MTIYDACLERTAELKETISELELKLLNAPSDSIRIHRNGNGFKWFAFHRTKDSPNGTRRYIPKKEQALALALALKTYNQKLLLDAKQELDALEGYLRKHDPTPGRAWRLLEETAGFKELLAPILFPVDSKFEEWQTEPYEKNPSHPENLVVRTLSGEYVRSKSEAMIAHLLITCGIPFRYECQTEICGEIFYPDFTILNPLTNQLVLWEHFGMIDDPTYARNTASKLELYFQAGYVPGRNLILTFESATAPLDIKEVEQHIRNTFLL